MVPTDAQQNKKIIDQCHKIAKKKIIQRPTDANSSKERMRQTVHGQPLRRAQKAKKAIANGKTFAGRLV